MHVRHICVFCLHDLPGLYVNYDRTYLREILEKKNTENKRQQRKRLNRMERIRVKESTELLQNDEEK